VLVQAEKLASTEVERTFHDNKWKKEEQAHHELHILRKKERMMGSQSPTGSVSKY